MTSGSSFQPRASSCTAVCRTAPWSSDCARYRNDDHDIRLADIGDQLGNDIFDWDRKDNRIPFSNYYDFRFDVVRNGRIVSGTPWIAPDTLYPSDELQENP